MTTADVQVPRPPFSRWRDFCQVIAKTVTAGSPETANGAEKLGGATAEPFSSLLDDVMTPYELTPDQMLIFIRSRSIKTVLSLIQLIAGRFPSPVK